MIQMQVKRSGYFVSSDIPSGKLVESGNADKLFSIDRIKYGLVNWREYLSIFGYQYDSHNEIERVGIHPLSKKWVYIFSLEESLDFILHVICGCDINNIRKMDDYLHLSRMMLKLDLERLNTIFPIGNFIDLDEKLNLYLKKNYLEINPITTVINLMGDVYYYSNQLIACAAVEFMRMCKEICPSQFVKRSYDMSSLVCCSDSYMDFGDVKISFAASDPYDLRIKAYNSLEYLDEKFNSSIFI